MKYIVILIFLYSNLILTEQQHPQFAIATVLARECPPCERIYTKRIQMKYLNDTRLKALSAIDNWLQKQPNALYKKNINELLNQIKKLSNSVIQNLAHDPKVGTDLEALKGLINKIDPSLPNEIRLENQNFYETMQEIWEIDNDLETQAVPDNYKQWLTKRINIRA